ncbi:hypothetical protein [Variovorax sp.]|uniref:hypothetical protein n=1 Tax=Variovorax sp. TaxID=1871043 RepID=UPI002D29330C|nr:hypothetical protein [Variovorax sp.]HYP85304.1 hypothetical protein [Variovorax sp.]
MATATCSAVAMFPDLARAQANTPPLVLTNVGSTPALGSGQAGGQGQNFSVTTGVDNIYGDNSANPAIELSSTGGAGGTGSDGGDPTGGGGDGGAAGAVSLNLIQSSGVYSGTTAAGAVMLTSNGGAGGTAGKMAAELGMPGSPGSGGNSAGVQMIQNGYVTSTNGWAGNTPGTTAVLMTANGGDAAEPLATDGAQGGGKQVGPSGGTGGTGGNINYTLGLGGVTSAGAGIVAVSQGGQGGDGYLATSDIGEGYGGAGGVGGNGGNITISTGTALATPTITATGAPTAATGATIPIDAQGNTAQAALMAAGIQAQSLGGVGGAGGLGDGSVSKAGKGGNAGDGGTVTLELGNTNISTSGYAAAGVLAQSVGGAGGTGSSAGSIFYTKGGNGGVGGNGNTVVVNMAEPQSVGWPTSLIATAGDDSMGVVAQSIGGGGGAGGAVATGSILAGVALGGNGESGGEAGPVYLNNGAAADSTTPAQAGFVISTQGEHSSGLVAQSIGGGGGAGGSATNTVLGPFTYTVGGTGGTGGDAGTPGITQVSVVNEGIVSTAGAHAKGVVAQAVGGGGGDGGSAMALTASAQLNVNVSVGGSGGSGGNAGDVVGTNGGEILTNGSDAWGLLTQSVSGGGGNGGMSTSDAFQFAATQAAPSVIINASIGGQGGSGGNSGNVTASNSGAIVTAGAAAHGILAQSIAGGGGNGGDSDALSVGASAGKGTSIKMTLALGGSGGEGGNAGSVAVDNSANALIWTLGNSANGILAQSVAGGGGSGGLGTGSTKFLGQGPTSGGTSTVSVGGVGGGGSAGGTVTVTNEGNIMTMGDGANGIFAQSVGGGGGVGSGTTASGSSGKISEKLVVAGSTANGASGTGGTVNVTNSATVVTFGGDAAGILAQSVGGGGGKAGQATTAGLPTANSSTSSLSNFLSTSAALKGLITPSSGVTAFGANGWQLSSLQQMERWGQDYLSYAAANSSGTLPDFTGGNIAMETYLGGGSSGDSTGGDATQGDGGAVNATNNFAIQTFGPASPGIAAQSIGAGGGIVGATAVNQFQVTSGNNAQARMTIGGNAINTGDGGAVTVTNSGNIGTQGDASFGVFAQSVGAGGGEATITASNFLGIAGSAIDITLAGNNASTGNGGPVTVNNTSSALNAAINTWGNEAVGIVAQSVGGGGGNVIVMQTTGNNGNSSGAISYADSKGLLNSVTVGSNSIIENQNATTCAVANGYLLNACGSGGAVTVNTSAASSIYTAGMDAHGILAQSIGGGGGWVMGITSGSNVQPFAKGAYMGGDGGAVNVSVGGTITTTNAGAIGVLAQSVGGGGVLSVGPSGISSPIAFEQASKGNGSQRYGAGGDIDISVAGSVSTSGSNAPAIFAQSVGGGGGLWSTASGTLMGSAGGDGAAGSIKIENTGTIQATGQGSSAIYTNSAGQGYNSQVAIYNSGTITGNVSAPAIVFTGANNNGDGSVVNGGTINALGGTAVSAPDSFAVVTNNAGGTINGDVQLGAAHGTMTNNGYWSTGSSSTAQSVTNNGTLNINGANGNALGTSTINGNFVNYGQLQSSVDFYNKQASVLEVSTGALQNGTTVLVRPQLLAPGAVTIMQGGLISSPQYIGVTDPGNNFLFSYGIVRPSVQVVQVTPLETTFYKQATAYTTNINLANLASSLDAWWGGSNGTITESLAQTYAGFATIGNGAAYINALSNLSNESSGAASVAHLAASNAFVERMNSCPRFEDGGLFQREHDCVWGRAIANGTDHGTSGDSVGYHQSSQVFQLGGQKEVAPDWFVGASVSADDSSLDTKTVNDTVSGNGWTAGLVAKHQMGDWLVSGAITAGQMSYDSTRSIQFPGMGGTATASYDVSHVGIHSRISRQLAYDTWYLKPYVDLHATHIESGGYTEQGAGPLNLRAAGSNTNVLGASPMLEAGTRFNLSGGMTLQAYAGVGATFYNQGNLGADFQFADSAPGGSSFHVSSDIPSNRIKTTAGLDLSASDRVNVRLEYTGEFADHFRSNTAALKATYKF